MRVKAHAVVSSRRIEKYGVVDGLTIIPDTGESASTTFYNGIIAIAPEGWSPGVSVVSHATLMSAAYALAAEIPSGEPSELIYIPLSANPVS